MRIVFLAVDDEFAGSMQRCVFERHPEWVVGSVISTCAIYKKSKLGATAFVLRRSGFRYGAEMFKMKVIRAMRSGNEKWTPSRLARDHAVDTFYSKNINDEQSLDQLKSWAPDLIISTNFSHYVGKRAREMARVDTWNLHKSYLPHYRGMAPSFYALLNGETQVGVTLHQITKGFDTGDIVQQVRIPVTAGDTVYSLNQRTSDVGGRMMADCLGQLDIEKVVRTPQPPGDWPNRSYPTRRDVRDFLRKGLRF